MDTIIYLYHSREPEQFITEKWQEKEYCLIRLGIPSLLWQNLKVLENALGDGEVRNEQEAESVIVTRKHRRFLRFGGRKQKSKRQAVEAALEVEQEKLAQRLREKAQREKLRTQISHLLEEVRELQTALCLLGDNPYWTYCVYEDFLLEKMDTGLWWECWSINRFEDYHDQVWVEELMQYAVWDSYLIVGYAPCLARILCGHAVKMRSVKWFLKPRQYTEAVQNFIEDFYEEYGLAIALQLLEESEDWHRVRPNSVVPVNVLDFSQEEKLSSCDVAKGSVWLDMDSLEGKERRIGTRNPGIDYFSLKKQWKQRQKEPTYLDTTNKNRYNT